MENLEILKDTLSAETYAAVEAETKDSDIKLADLSGGGYVSQSKYDALASQLASTEKLLTDKTSEYETLKATAGDNEALRNQITQMQTDFETEKNQIKADAAETLKKAKVTAQIMSDYHPKDVNDILTHIDFAKITEDGDKLIGVKEQVDPLKESKAYLFEDEKKGGGASGMKHGDGGDDYSAIRKAFGLKSNDKK